MALKSYPLFQARIKQTQGTHQTTQNQTRLPVSNMLGNFFSGIMKKINNSSSQKIQEEVSYQQQPESFSNTFSNCPSRANLASQNVSYLDSSKNCLKNADSIVSAPVGPHRPMRAKPPLKKIPQRPHAKRRVLRPKRRGPRSLIPSKSIPVSIQQSINSKNSKQNFNQNNLNSQISKPTINRNVTSGENCQISNSFGDISQNRQFPNSHMALGRQNPVDPGSQQVSSIMNFNSSKNAPPASLNKNEGFPPPAPQMFGSIPPPPRSGKNLKKKRKIMAKRFVAFDRHNL